MAEVICVGVAFLDHIFEANPPTSPDSKTFATEYRQFGGGMAARRSCGAASVTIRLAVQSSKA